MEHILFLTGHLARPGLERVLAQIDPAPFTWEARDLGLQVAGLMTADMIRRRVPLPVAGEAARHIDRIIVPGTRWPWRHGGAVGNTSAFRCSAVRRN